jgi:hypothetical protein
LGYNHVFLVGQRVDKMGQMLEEQNWRNCQERIPNKNVCYYVIILEVQF